MSDKIIKISKPANKEIEAIKKLLVEKGVATLQEIKDKIKAEK